MKSTATIPTAHASRYLQQLCKHWSHRFEIVFTPVAGRIPFGPDRACLLDASDTDLRLIVEAPDEAGLTRLQGVVLDHLQRFAFREAFAAPVWTAA